MDLVTEEGKALSSIKCKSLHQFHCTCVCRKLVVKQKDIKENIIFNEVIFSCHRGGPPRGGGMMRGGRGSGPGGGMRGGPPGMRGRGGPPGRGGRGGHFPPG